MRKTIVIADNALLPASWETFETEDVIATLINRYGAKFPDNARLYHGNVSQANDVTPRNAADIEHLSNLEGKFYAVNFPAGPLTLIALAIVAVVAIAAIALRPKVPNSATRNVQSESPNNSLSNRTNSIRINGRIPDIFGQVRSTPDLIAVPYSIFEDHKEAEYTYMCIGRGAYEISADFVRDGTTPVSQIAGESLEIYGPETSPNTGDAAQLTIGTAIDRPVIAAVRSKSVNGQTLIAGNEGAINDADQTFDFEWPNIIESNGSEPDFTEHFSPGETFELTTEQIYSGFPNANTVVHGYDVKVFLDNEILTTLDNVQNHSVRFHSDGRIEFQSLTDIGTSTRPLNDDGRALLTLSAAAVTDGSNNADLAGSYVVTALSGSVLQCESPGSSSNEWANLIPFAGSVSPYVTATFDFRVDARIYLSGTYTIDTVSATELTLVTPDNIRHNNHWQWLKYYPRNGHPAFIIDNPGDVWVGPFVLDVATADELIFNFVALNGLYKDDGSDQFASDVDVQVGVTPCTSAGVATGPETFQSMTLEGSATVRGTRAGTLFAALPSPGRYMARARRVTPKDLSFDGQISDEVKWRDLYASSPVGSIAFGDITTVHCKTVATEQALAVSERQINMLVTRKLPLRISGSTFSGTLTATQSADEIIAFVCLDPKLGNRSVNEIDFDQIYDTVQEVKDYFGVDEAGEFNYTFDSANLSFEETLFVIADAVFCNPHRRGNVIELFFEKLTPDSKLLFNHRNKVPGSEKRSVSFGNLDGFDGIEYEYVSPTDDAVVPFYIPEDQSAVKPRKIESIGVRSLESAYLHAWREYNRLRYQHLAVEFTATSEAEVLTNGERILVVDNTRPDIQDGHIDAQDGLLLTLSQPCVLKEGIDYVISLQLASGIVENIAITGFVDDSYSVLLATPPSEDLVTDDDSIAKTVYQIVRDEDTEQSACIVQSKDPDSNFTHKITAINYDARYYENDQDFA